MCLNQLLEDEQIALMRYAAAISPAAIDRYTSEVETVARRLKAHPYHHRPYHPANRLRAA